MPLIFSDNTIGGCAYCGGLKTDVTKNNDNSYVPVGYLSCKLPIVASSSALITLTVTGFNALITNVVCDNANSYFLTDLNTCTLMTGFGPTSTTGIITKCADGYY